MYFKEDEILAEELQHILNMDGASGGQNNGDDGFEFIDPEETSPELLPNIHELFDVFNKLYFWDALGMVEVKWSPKMRSSCGRCYYRRKGRSCCIKLSVPLLAERPLKDVIDTLLHEMIHAYLFVTGNENNREDHGAEFLQHMVRINDEAGTNIAIYDNFEPGPTHRQRHIWRCNGPCRNRRPTFGFIKKRMNKEPGPDDPWWADHQNQCGGSFTKISEPINDNNQTVQQGEDETEGARGPRDDGGAIPRESRGAQPSVSFEDDLPNAQDEKGTQNLNDLPGCSDTETKKRLTQPEPDDDEFDSAEVTLDDEKIKKEYLRVEETVKNAWTGQDTSPEKMKPKTKSMRVTSQTPIKKKDKQMECPVCRKTFGENVINEHIDECLIEGACMPVVNEPIKEPTKASTKEPTKASTKESTKASTKESTKASTKESTKASTKESTKASTKEPTPAKETVQDKVELFYEERVNRKLVPCPICTSLIHPDVLKGHLTDCLFYGMGNENPTEEDIEDDEDDEMDRDKVLCPCCFRWVPERSLDDHMSECLAYIHQGSSEHN